MLLIDGHHAPRVGRTSGRGLREIPLRGGRVRRVVGYRIESPPLHTRPSVKGANYTTFDVSRPVIPDR